MTLSLDHVFVITEPGAAAGDRLIELGMAEGRANTHPGQGTANRRFFLNGFVLELLFVQDEEESATGAGCKLGLLQRSRSHQASPFGIVARVTDNNSVPEFDSWQYFPDYFNGELCFYVGSNSALRHEPLCICMPPTLPLRGEIPVQQSNPDWSLTALEITVPDSTPSAVLEEFAEMDKVTLGIGNDHHLDLVFNQHAGSQSADLRPALPLTISW